MSVGACRCLLAAAVASPLGVASFAAAAADLTLGIVTAQTGPLAGPPKE